MFNHLTLISLLLIFLLPLSNSYATTSTQKTILTISYTQEGIEREKAYSLADLESLKPHVIQTSTPWTKGIQTFEGVLLRDLIPNSVTNTLIKGSALNDYSAEIPISDAYDYDVVVAYKHNGSYMPVRKYGPLWIIYPLDQHQELSLPSINHRWIWQLKALQFVSQ